MLNAGPSPSDLMHIQTPNNNGKSKKNALQTINMFETKQMKIHFVNFIRHWHVGNFSEHFLNIMAPLFFHHLYHVPLIILNRIRQHYLCCMKLQNIKSFLIYAKQCSILNNVKHSQDKRERCREKAQSQNVSFHFPFSIFLGCIYAHTQKKTFPRIYWCWIRDFQVKIMQILVLITVKIRALAFVRSSSLICIPFVHFSDESS